MLSSLLRMETELNTFSLTNAIYRDRVFRANEGIYRLRGGTPWRYAGEASCISKQTVIRLNWLLRPDYRP